MKYFLLLLLLAVPACALGGGHSQSFGSWLEAFRQEARSQGISDKTLDDAFKDTAPIDRIIELDRKQPEGTLTLAQYLANTINKSRIEDGRARFADNRELLEKIGTEYGVQPRYIVALWGIETHYGEHTGGFRTVDALATLAYDGRRSGYFRGELLKALHIIEDEHIDASTLQGSWAGALGQCQFMPTSFLSYAVDYDKDGKRDIWGTQADVFASIANYLNFLGWNANEEWGFAVALPKEFNTAQADINVKNRRANGRRLASVKKTVAICRIKTTALHSY